MMRPKKNKKGAGRKASDAYSKLSTDGKALYHHNVVRKSRGLPTHSHLPSQVGGAGDVTQGRKQAGQTMMDLGKQLAGLCRTGPGRPPLDEVNGKMDEEQLMERKRFLAKEAFKREKVSMMRKEQLTRGVTDT